MANNISLYYFAESAGAALAESVAAGAVIAAESVTTGATAAESVTTVVESVVASVLEEPLLQATKNAATAKTRNNFFICLIFKIFLKLITCLYQV
jgi:hypothetical protein